jgi:hypothetical protein
MKGGNGGLVYVLGSFRRGIAREAMNSPARGLGRGEESTCNAAALSPRCPYDGDDFLVRRWHSESRVRTGSTDWGFPVDILSALDVGIVIAGIYASRLAYTLGEHHGAIEVSRPRVFLSISGACALIGQKP